MSDKSSSSRLTGMSPQLLVADINQSIKFYVEQLGFEVSFLYDDFYAGIARDGYSIHLKTGSPAPGEREHRKKNEDLDITFSVDGIDGLYSEMKNKEVQIIQPLREMPYGSEFYITDPDGYTIAFLQEK